MSRLLVFLVMTLVAACYSPQPDNRIVRHGRELELRATGYVYLRGDGGWWAIEENQKLTVVHYLGHDLPGHYGPPWRLTDAHYCNTYSWGSIVLMCDWPVTWRYECDRQGQYTIWVDD